MRPTVRAIGLCGLFLAAAPGWVSAQTRVTSLEGEPWADVVSGLAERRGAEGTLVEVCARRADGGRCLPCGDYTLALDSAAAEAFAIGSCDPATGATALRLAHRTALFDHSHAVPVPRPVRVTAMVHAGAATESVTPRSAGSSVRCSVQIRPYVRDLEHGEIVYLRPDAYEVRVAQTRFHVDSSADGAFVISSTDGAVAEIAYDVIERSTGTVTVVGRTTLSCASTVDVPATEPLAVAPFPTTPEVTEQPSASPNQRTGGGSGIRVAQRGSTSGTSEALVLAGIDLAAVGALGLIAIGIVSLVQVAPECTGYTTSATHTCTAWGPPRTATTPEELTWAALGTLGVGVLLGVVGWSLPRGASRDELSVDLGVDPTGARVHLQLAF